MLLWLLLACPAEQLGIPVPEAGVEAIAMEDLRRDLHRLSAGEAAADTPSGAAARDAFLAERMDQMGLAWEGRCGVRRGTGTGRVVVLAEPAAPGDRAGWLAAATVISVAKAFHGRKADPREVRFCVGSAPAGDRVLVVGPLGAAEAVWTARAPLGEATVDPTLEVDLRVAQPAASDADVDLRRAEALAKALVPVVEGWAEGG